MYISIIFPTFVEININYMRDYFIYVALSECKTITKVGMSTGVSTRMAGLKLSEGQSFKPLFISTPKSKKEALEIEASVNNKFKKMLLKVMNGIKQNQS